MYCNFLICFIDIKKFNGGQVQIHVGIYLTEIGHSAMSDFLGKVTSKRA